jgi:dynein heavy chain
LNYLVALVNYGGRVTDDKDVRLIEAMLKKYFTAEIMGDNYKLSKLPFYYAPPDGSYDACVAYINQLPLDEDPEVFGLHPNANITYENNTVNFFMDCILQVQPRVKGKGNQQSPEQIVAAKAREMFTRLPSLLETKKANEQTLQRDKDGNIINSLGVFCN